MKFNMSGYVVRANDGSVDTKATAEKFDLELAQFCANSVSQTAEIQEAVTAMFDSQPAEQRGECVLCERAVHTVMSRMNVSNEDFVETKEAIMSFLRTSTEYVVTRGRSGGVYRVCDKKEKPAKK
jgi:hypothetical protein